MSPGRTGTTSEVVDATLLAAREATLDRTFRLQELDRLAELAAGEEVSLHVRFYMVDRRVAIAGHARAMLKLTCQRCLEPMVTRVNDEFHVVVVESEVEMEQLSSNQEALVADPASLDLRWLIEEQVLLAMPLVPVHDDVAECSNSTAGVKQKPAPAQRSPEPTQRPFANLRDLMVADDKE